MWLVCYEVHGQTHYAEFDSHDEALECFFKDSGYYEKEWGRGNFKIYLAEVQKKAE